LSSRQGSAVVFAFAVACSFVCHPVRDLLLSLLLLSAAASRHITKEAPSTEAARASCEQRSGEIRFSTQSSPVACPFHHPNVARNYHLAATP
jgi:hypothetical protein